MNNDGTKTQKMQAIIHTRYGSPEEVLELSNEVDKPTPKENEVLVEVHAASLNAIDKLIVDGKSLFLRITTGGFRKPSHKILGDDIAGKVESVGKNVKNFKPGDEVFGMSNWGAFAEYRCVPENRIIHKPSNISFEEAAAVPIAGITALKGLRDYGKIQEGQKVLINGASGGTGTFGIQVAKAYGTEVTGVCSTSKMSMVKSIGADHVIDYTQEDFTKSEQKYDLIVDFAAYRPVWKHKRVLNPRGIYVCIGGSMTQFFQALLIGPLISIIGNKKLIARIPIPKHEDFQQIKEFLEAGKIVPVIDKCYPLNKTAEAIQYLLDGQARGKIVITMKNSTKG